MGKGPHHCPAIYKPLKPNQIITGLKQAMQENVIRVAPLKARKGLETRGNKPQPGERTITREQYKAQEQKSREALREQSGKGTPKATNKSDAIIDFVSDAEKIQRPYDHLVNVDGFKRGGRAGISGGHNKENFYKALEEDASKYGLDVQKDYIIGEPRQHSIKGIYEIEYQIPSLQRNELDRSIFEPIKHSEGTVVGKRVNDPKTIYDPNIISNEKIYNLGRAALEPQIKAGNVKNGIVKGELNGLKFVGFVDDDGNISIFSCF